MVLHVAVKRASARVARLLTGNTVGSRSQWERCDACSELLARAHAADSPNTLWPVKLDNFQPSVIGEMMANQALVFAVGLVTSSVLGACTVTHEETDTCRCFSTVEREDDFGPYTDVENSCGATVLCDEAKIEPSDFDHSVYVAQNPAAVDCVLGALASGEIGLVQYRFNQIEVTHFHKLYIQGEQAYHESYSIDLTTGHDGIREIRLRPAAEFEACLQAEDLVEKLACLEHPEAEILDTCIEL